MKKENAKNLGRKSETLKKGVSLYDPLLYKKE